MTRRPHPSLCCLAVVLCATPLWAEGNLDPSAPAAPGAVALYLQAHALQGLGQTLKDPLLVLTAAQILRGLTLTDTARTPDPAPDAPTTLTPLNPDTLLDAARTLDAGAQLTDLIDSITRQSGPTPKALRATAETLNPATAQTWTLTFFGGTYAELAILGDGRTNLDMLVTDDAGMPICQDNGNADTALCGFTPVENGSFSVTVTNSGTTAGSYILLTN